MDILGGLVGRAARGALGSYHCKIFLRADEGDSKSSRKRHPGGLVGRAARGALGSYHCKISPSAVEWTRNQAAKGIGADWTERRGVVRSVLVQFSPGSESRVPSPGSFFSLYYSWLGICIARSKVSCDII